MLYYIIYILYCNNLYIHHNNFTGFACKYKTRAGYVGSESVLNVHGQVKACRTVLHYYYLNFESAVITYNRRLFSKFHSIQFKAARAPNLEANTY